MDDVGQTLLNWASAFGTQEMVEFLCAKGKEWTIRILQGFRT
jgi:E3 ubiquitin-protein ligase HECTD1